MQHENLQVIQQQKLSCMKLHFQELWGSFSHLSAFRFVELVRTENGLDYKMSVKVKDFEKLKEKYEKLVADHEVLKFRMKYYK